MNCDLISSRPLNSHFETINIQSIVNTTITIQVFKDHCEITTTYLYNFTISEPFYCYFATIVYILDASLYICNPSRPYSFLVKITA